MIDFGATIDELEKISKKQEPWASRTAIAAHEMGHAQDYERTRIPGLRTAGRVIGPIAGFAGGVAVSRKVHPLAGAGVAALGMAPMLADEAIASFKAMKELRNSKKFSQDEIKKMRGQLMRAGGTYLSSAAGLSGAAAALGRGKPDLAELSLIAGSLGSLGLATSMAAGLEEAPKSDKAQLEALRKQMGIKGSLYRAKEIPGRGMGGRWSELGAFYMPKTKSKLWRMYQERNIGDLVEGEPKKLQKLLSEGGVVLPRAKV